MKIATSVLAILVAASAAIGQASETGTMVKTVDGFYRAYETFRPPDGIPKGTVLRRFQPFISPTLDKLFIAGEIAENRYEQVTKGQYPPLIEGDVFTPNFEGATSFVVGPCEADAHGGHCAVSLSYDGGQKPLHWTDLVSLVHTSSGWRVDDIAYGGNWDFGAKGRLSDTLRSAIEHGNGVRE
jgi:hypothetical protein